MTSAIRKWLEIRIGLDELIRSQLTEYRVPRNLNLLYTLGTVALGAFVVQCLTGIILLFYYVPQDQLAFKSVQVIMDQVPYGWLFRLIHLVGSNLMVAVVLLHLASSFFLGSYKKPRELTWVVGALLLLTTLAIYLSGYLLPWSQLSYWGITVVTDVPTAIPLVGKFITQFLRGGSGPVSDLTLNRFFAFHVGVLPLLMISLLALHVFLVRRIGISAPPLSADAPKDWQVFHHEDYPQGQPFYPDFIRKGAIAVAVYFMVMFCIIAFVPGLFLSLDAATPADPLKTPLHIRPEWPFRAAYEVLKLIPIKFLGIAVQLVLLAVFILWPFLDKSPERNILKRPLLLSLFLGTIAVWIALTIKGSY